MSYRAVIALLLVGLLGCYSQKDDGFSLLDAMDDGGDHKQTPKPPGKADDGFSLLDAMDDDGDHKQTPKPPGKAGDDFNLADATEGGGGYDPVPPNPPKPRPNPNPKQPGTSGGFSDADLMDVVSEGGGGGDPGKHRKEGEGETQADSPGVLSGIIGAVVVAVAGAVSSFIAYQKKKWCFKESDGAKI